MRLVARTKGNVTRITVPVGASRDTLPRQRAQCAMRVLKFLTADSGELRLLKGPLSHRNRLAGTREASHLRQGPAMQSRPSKVRLGAPLDKEQHAAIFFIAEVHTCRWVDTR